MRAVKFQSVSWLGVRCAVRVRLERRFVVLVSWTPPVVVVVAVVAVAVVCVLE